MKASSAKARGRRAAAEVRDALLAVAPSLLPDDILVTPSGVTGEDIRLSPAAQKEFPFCFEVKNQEALNIWSALEQASDHSAISQSPRFPVVCFRRNRSKLYIAMDLKDFLAVFKGRK